MPSPIPTVTIWAALFFARVWGISIQRHVWRICFKAVYIILAVFFIQLATILPFLTLLCPWPEATSDQAPLANATACCVLFSTHFQVRRPRIFAWPTSWLHCSDLSPNQKRVLRAHKRHGQETRERAAKQAGTSELPRPRYPFVGAKRGATRNTVAPVWSRPEMPRAVSLFEGPRH